MNYLAHLFLSGDDPELQFGNFIADGVRATQIHQYPSRIQEGIRLHYKIDAYTDCHPIVAETKVRLRSKFRKYAGVVADVYYDHFLAKQFGKFSAQSLPDFAAQSYALLLSRPELLPARVLNFLPHMVRHNWLLSYAEVIGVSRALEGLSRRAIFNSGMELAGDELVLHYKQYEGEFNRFFPELQAYVSSEIKNLNVL